VFTKCYPSGHLSDMGNASILSGYAASPSVSILMMPNKSASLPMINKPLQAIGYNSNYYFGGQLTYGNIKQYLIQGGFNNVQDETNIENKNYKLQRLGINDADMAQVFLEGINKSKQPFLNCWFTISSHSPYDVALPYKKLTELENPYTNTVMYTDSVLQQFFMNAKKQTWYKNTLFVIVSDHSHISHRNENIMNAEYHRIPLLFYGDVLQKKWMGKKINYTVSQLDVSYTLLESMGLKNELAAYNFSKSLLNTSTHFAPYTYFNGAGLVYDSSVASYDLRNLNKPAWEKNTSAAFLRLTRAFGAVNYEDYRKR
jgi:phosphoglycerol transferase MdoB-like AlkP superfamily enzyme